MRTESFRTGMLSAAIASAVLAGSVNAAPSLKFQQKWTEGGSGNEIVAIDAASGRVFETFSGGVEIRDLNSGVSQGVFTVPNAGDVNSVAVKNGVVAIAVQGSGGKQSIGHVAFFNTTDAPGSAPMSVVDAQFLPDMVTFTPDGNTVLVANEGEPNDSYTIDPEGSVSIIDISGGIAGVSNTDVTNLDFNSFNGSVPNFEADGWRVFGPGASVAEDVEPEYIAVSPDGSTAFVTLQENNAVAKIDIANKTVTEIQGLFFKDHSLAKNSLDASNEDGPLDASGDPTELDGNLQTWPVMGMYQPDAIDSYVVGGQTYYITANEGDGRDYDPGFENEGRVKDLNLDLDDDGVADTFSPLQDDDQLGRLKTTLSNGDTDGDGLNEIIYSYGARSFSIWDDAGNLVADTGNIIESIIFNEFPERWVDSRSDDKGPEPEAIKIVELDQFFYALVGLERTSGFMVFDITDPTAPTYMDYIFNAGDIAIEGIDFELISDAGSDSWGWVAIANEVSQTTTFYRVSFVPVPATLALLGFGALLMRGRRR